jgi:DNA-binding response OmpR family regulator
MARRILLIEDDSLVLEMLKMILTQAGYQVLAAATAQDGLKKGLEGQPDLIILDVMLPEMDGWELCQRFRNLALTPIIILSALGSEADIVKGLALGADNYLVKPVTGDILIAKVKALLRRAALGAEAAADGRAPVLKYQALTIDLDGSRVTVGKKPIKLSPTEYKLLTVLMQHKHRAVSKQVLLAEVWGPEFIGDIDRLRLYISYLRQKIEPNPAEPSFIHNVWGIGYRLG